MDTKVKKRVSIPKKAGIVLLVFFIPWASALGTSPPENTSLNGFKKKILQLFRKGNEPEEATKNLTTQILELKEAGRWEEANQVCDEVLKTNPKEKKIRSLKGEILLALQRPVEATEILKAAQLEDPGSNWVATLLARAYLKSNRLGAAKLLISELLLKSKESETLRLASEIFLQDRQIEKAKGLLEELKQRNSKDPWPREQLFDLYMARGEQSEVDQVALESQENNVVSSKLQTAAADYHLRQGQPEKAKKLTESALRLSPTYLWPRLLLAQIHLQQKNTEKVHSLLSEKFIQGEVPEVNLLRAKAFMFQEKFADAEAELNTYSKLIKKSGRSPASQSKDQNEEILEFTRAELYLSTRHYDQAANLSRQALQKFPKSSWGRKLLLEAEFQSGKFDELLADAKQLDPSEVTPDTLLLEAQVYQEKKQYDQAENKYAEAFNSVPNQKLVPAFLWRKRIQNLISSGNISQAKKVLGEASQVDPCNHEILNVSTDSTLWQGDKNQPIQYLTKLKTEHSNCDEIKLVLAHLYLSSGLAPQALKEVETTKSQNLRSVLIQAYAYREMGLLQKGEQVLRKALERFPDDPSVVGYLVSNLRSQKKKEEAYQIVNSASDRNPDNVLLHNIKAEILLGMGRLGAALEELKKSLRLDPGNEWGNALTALTYKRLNKNKLALDHINSAIANLEKEPVKSDNDQISMASYLSLRGEVYLNLFEGEKAENDLRQALNFSAQEFWVKRLLARALSNLGRKEEAKRVLEDAIVSARNSKEANLAKIELKQVLGHLGEADSILKQEIQKEPENLDFHLSRAANAYLSKDFWLFENEMKEVIQRDPSNLTAAVDLAHFYSDRRRYDEADLLVREAQSACSQQNDCTSLESIIKGRKFNHFERAGFVISNSESKITAGLLETLGTVFSNSEEIIKTTLQTAVKSDEAVSPVIPIRQSARNELAGRVRFSAPNNWGDVIFNSRYVENLNKDDPFLESRSIFGRLEFQKHLVQSPTNVYRLGPILQTRFFEFRNYAFGSGQLEPRKYQTIDIGVGAEGPFLSDATSMRLEVFLGLANPRTKRFHLGVDHQVSKMLQLVAEGGGEFTSVEIENNRINRYFGKVILSNAINSWLSISPELSFTNRHDTTLSVYNTAFSILQPSVSVREVLSDDVRLSQKLTYFHPSQVPEYEAISLNTEAIFTFSNVKKITDLVEELYWAPVRISVGANLTSFPKLVSYESKWRATVYGQLHVFW